MSYRVNFQKYTNKKNKYGAKSTTYTSAIHGTRTFHSKKEAGFCENLDWLLQAGEIKTYSLQHKIEIRIHGKLWANYYIDFRVVDKHDQIKYIEVKGFETEVWRLKWKALEILKEDLLEEGAEIEIVK
jgi:hypothetical protein